MKRKLLASLRVLAALVLTVFATNAVSLPAVFAATPTQTTPLPANGVESLEYTGNHWKLKLQDSQAWEIKLITPAPQEIACSGNHAGGAPTCSGKVFTFGSQATCVTVQVDWKNNVHNSSDVTECQSTPTPPTKIQIPAQPSVADLCGPNNATWNVPANTDVLTWSLNAGDLVVTIVQSDMVFTDNTTTHDYGVAPDSGTVCPPTQIEVPAQPSFTDVCGLNNASWILPADTDKISWNINIAGHLIATISVANTVFVGGETTHDYGVAPDSGELCPVQVTPGVPTFKEQCGTKQDTYTIPATEGVRYKVNGLLTTAGTYTGSGMVTITAEALTGYELTGTASWSQAFETTPCPPKHHDQKVTLCHATGLLSSPYVQITASAAGAYYGHYLQHEDDIIPAFTYRGQMVPAKNWTTANQAIYNSGCTAPQTPPTNTCTPDVLSAGNSLAITGEDDSDAVDCQIGGKGGDTPDDTTDTVVNASVTPASITNVSLPELANTGSNSLPVIAAVTLAMSLAVGSSWLVRRPYATSRR